MHAQELPGILPLKPEGQVVIVEAEPGVMRRDALQALVAAQSPGNRTWLLPCDIEQGGIWAGLNAWLGAIFPDLETAAADLVARHDFELVTVLPELRRKVRTSRISLTDTAGPTETVRNYAIDRAYRIGQGLVDLLDSWHSRNGGGSWLVVCDDFDRSGALVRRFFRELVRRRGRKLGLNLVLAVDPGNADAMAAQLPPGTAPRTVNLAIPATVRKAVGKTEMAERARALESRVGEDPLEIEIHLPELIGSWCASDEPTRALRWQAMALGLYNHYGFYEDALAYSGPVLANLDVIPRQDSFFTRWNLVGSLFGCLVAVGEVDRAYKIVKEEALEKVTDAGDLARVCYVMAMLHARFLQRKDLAKAEEYLARGLQELDVADLPERDRHFLRVFLLNGLAFVRHRQGRPYEAVDLCKDGFEHLEKNLKPGQHRLHRSVLLCNMAQVYAALGVNEKALESFTAAMEMDPNYSEYYNERGNVHLSMERYGEAIRDYRAAIALSPPYPEVWTNLGQCYRLMGQHPEAVEAYSVALDLDPRVLLARLGRAQIFDAEGRVDEALADYDAALEIDPRQPLVLGNRAVISYGQGRLDRALVDLDAAISLSPETAELFQNRAVALSELGRIAEASRDLETYLRLLPEAEDRQEVELKLAMYSQMAGSPVLMTEADVEL